MLLAVLGFLVILVRWFVNAIWLAILGQWFVIGIGLVAGLLGIELARTGRVRAPADKGFGLGGMFFPFLATLYLYGLVIAWNLIQSRDSRRYLWILRSVDSIH